MQEYVNLLFLYSLILIPGAARNASRLRRHTNARTSSRVATSSRHSAPVRLSHHDPQASRSLKPRKPRPTTRHLNMRRINTRRHDTPARPAPNTTGTATQHDRRAQPPGVPSSCVSPARSPPPPYLPHQQELRQHMPATPPPARRSPPRHDATRCDVMRRTIPHATTQPRCVATIHGVRV
jgi:hypothetical protein